MGFPITRQHQIVTESTSFLVSSVRIISIPMGKWKAMSITLGFGEHAKGQLGQGINRNGME